VYFMGLNSKGLSHNMGASYLMVPAFGTTRNIGLNLWEDDNNPDWDEDDMAWYDINLVPKQPEYLSTTRNVTFNGNGDYRISGCNFAHQVRALGCQSNAGCDPTLKCVGGVCDQVSPN